MSEISVLSNQYEKLVRTSDKINNSVIVLKKRGLLSHKDIHLKYPKLKLSEIDYSSAMKELLSFLQNLSNLLNDENRTTDDLPLVILDDYKSKLNESSYFKDDLNQLIEDLKASKNLEEKDIRVLDRIISVLDNERTLLFRKLRTARG